MAAAAVQHSATALPHSVPLQGAGPYRKLSISYFKLQAEFTNQDIMELFQQQRVIRAATINQCNTEVLRKKFNPRSGPFSEQLVILLGTNERCHGEEIIRSERDGHQVALNADDHQVALNADDQRFTNNPVDKGRQGRGRWEG